MRRHKGERGVATILIVGVLLVFLIFFLVLAIDFAYIYVVRGQVQNAADASALAGAAIMECDGLDLVQTDARDEAITFAAQNFAGGDPVQIITDGSNTLSEDNDITVGYWDGTEYHPGQQPVNALHVRPRRTEDSPGGKVALFFGRLVGWPEMEVSRLATAQGCLKNLSPISVNEYWMGDDPLGSCSPARYDPDREPYGRNHVYPNSFVRPPCGTLGANNCASPSNGNMTKLAGIKDCAGITNAVGLTPNGPLTVDCNTLGPGACDGRPPGKPRASRVFAVVGGNARDNAAAYNIFGIIDLDLRIGFSNTAPGEQWYRVAGETFTTENNGSSGSDKSTTAGYIASGRYPHLLPTSVVEVYQPGYTAVTLYTSSNPYASTSYFRGAGLLGQNSSANFYDRGNYSGGKYEPGDKVIVTVYDGIKGGGSGSDSRTTIVGFAVVTIFGYGKEMYLNGSGQPMIGDPAANNNTMYGYIENINDSLTQGFEDVPPFSGKSKLVE
jgi:hypothetical protein